MTTGEIAPVEGTPMDFRSATRLKRIDQYEYVQLKNGDGYDHNWVLNTNGDISQVAAVYSPVSGIQQFTTEPGGSSLYRELLDGSLVGS